jgi:hypothetical protein
MPLRSLLPRRSDARFLRAGAAALAGLLLASAARAELPESPYQREDPHRPEPALMPDERDGRAEAWEPTSTFRFHVGPAALLEPASPGLFTALDVGQRAVGARLSAAWLRAESAQGLSSYSAELWIDFRHRSALHPVLGAGASLLRGGALGQKDQAGAGSLRGALEYELPLVDAEARLSLTALLLVPAIASERTRPWTMAALTVGAGF